MPALLPHHVAAESWPIKSFKVVKQNPSRITWDDVAAAHAKALLQTDPGEYQRYQERALYLENRYEQQLRDEENAPEISHDVVRETEDWLNTLASVYEQMGFRPPLYTDIDSSVFGHNRSFPGTKNPADAGFLNGDFRP